MEMGKKMKLHRDLVPLTVLASMECLNVGLNTLFKAATLHGMNHRIFMVYVYGVASLILLPSPFISHRSKKGLPPVRFSLIWKVFLLGVIGCVSQEMGYAGINYSSPTLASAMSNLIPAFTFILATTFKMEKVALKSRSSQAKILGTIVSLMGAFVVTLYKGPAVIMTGWSSTDQIPSNWVIGGICLMAQNIMIPICYILQSHIMKEYKDEKTILFFYNLCVTILAALVGLVTERDVNAWRSPIGLSIGLASVLCSGVFGSFLNNVVHSWALKKKGPVYVTMFKPLSIAFAVAMGMILLGDTLYLGSIIGAIVILVGFYIVMWGKAREEIREVSEISDDIESPSKDNKLPLLKDNEKLPLLKDNEKLPVLKDSEKPSSEEEEEKI
ncbi:WAT1-related protein At3g28050-like [Impatiens glandulifera]|uniref:WAT1-related protein At3g28050-like n=1 Tax=Impatiens glandulifera TaxID=253017 RepID=UPI001FB08EF5|nr:WAT1-related protein At3g28050-like [Impatiens glandulifera]